MYRVSSPCRIPLAATQARTCGVNAYNPLPWVRTVISWKSWRMAAILANPLCYTRSMLFLIPHLFPTTRLLQAAAQDLRLPALQTLLARGTRRSCPAEGVEAALCETLGIARQQDWPLAPITLAADGGEAGEAYWLRADPVHLQVMRDRIVLAGSDVLALSREEANTLADAIARHFGGELSPQPHHPQRWYLKCHAVPHLSTTPLSLAVGRDIDPLLPQGRDGQRFRTLLNELQMLMHDHPVNLAREARGELPVNSLWLWGGGTRPVAPGTRVPFYARDDASLALGAFGGAQVSPLPLRLDGHLLAPGSIFVLDELARAAQCGDAYGWREALRTLEGNWFEPLLRNLHRLPRSGAHRVDPINGRAILLRRTDAWKIWRRPHSLQALLS